MTRSPSTASAPPPASSSAGGTVHGNRYCWTNNDGSQPSPWFAAYGNLSVTNNVRDCSIDPAILRVTLP